MWYPEEFNDPSTGKAIRPAETLEELEAKVAFLKEKLGIK